LIQRNLNLPTEEAYTKLKTALTQKGCTVLSEAPPNQICCRQGTLWGIDPKTAKKNLTFTLTATPQGTNLEARSELAAEWKDITVVGCVLGAIFAGLCFWLASDLSALLGTGAMGFWSSLLAADALSAGSLEVLIRLAYGLTGFLVAVILLEAAITVYVKSKIDAYTQEVLGRLG
jgi:hypothetical protein